MIDVKKIEEIIKLYEKYKLPGLHIETPQETIIIGSGPLKTQTSQNMLQQHQSPSQELNQSKENSEISLTEDSKEENESGFLLTSPFVGTFYSSHEPGGEPFVQSQTKIKPGDTLAIIEAMKIMNEVQSEIEGTLIECLVQDGDLVEFGTPLFRILPCL